MKADWTCGHVMDWTNICILVINLFVKYWLHYSQDYLVIEKLSTSSIWIIIFFFYQNKIKYICEANVVSEFLNRGIGSRSMIYQCDILKLYKENVTSEKWWLSKGSDIKQ